MSRVLSYELTRAGQGWQLNFELDQEALQGLIARRFGRTALVTSREGGARGRWWRNSQANWWMDRG